MAYGIKYMAEYDTLAGTTCRVEILVKDYSGLIYPLVLSASPVVQTYNDDEPDTSIKGCSLTLTLQNVNNQMPIETFYADDDVTFKLKHYVNGLPTFEGFIVQDDCSEEMLDYRHDIILSANDSLGLLKDIALNATAVDDIDFYGYNDLLSIIKACLLNTGLELNTTVFANIFETRHSTSDSFLPQTYINTQTFLDNDAFKSCWDTLEIILKRFKLTLFQGNGQWYIVRFNELRYGSINGFVYNSDFDLVGTSTFGTSGEELQFGFSLSHYPETAPQRTILSRYKFDKETFNYKQPKYLILNSDLQNLGDFISTSTVGDYRYDKYEFPADSEWKHLFASTPQVDVSYIIVVTQISINKETDRYVYQPKTNAGGSFPNSFANVEFNDIQVSALDKIDEFSFSIKAASSTGGDAVIWRFGILLLEDNGSYWTLNSTANTWSKFFVNPNTVAPAFTHTVLAADAENYYSFSLASFNSGNTIAPFPVDGVLRIRVYGSNDNNASQPNVDAIWKDLKLTISQNINQTIGIIGHTHTQEQPPVIKNNSDEEIFIDDSPRSAISGTLFLNTFTGLVRLKTILWNRAGFTDNKAIGEIITFEELFKRRIPRTKIEGTFYNVDGVQMLQRVVYYPGILSTYQFLFGRLEILYKENRFDCTLYQMVLGESDGDLDNTYTFKYLYATK